MTASSWWAQCMWIRGGRVASSSEPGSRPPLMTRQAIVATRHLVLKLSLAGDRATTVPVVSRFEVAHWIRVALRSVSNEMRQAAPTLEKR